MTKLLQFMGGFILSFLLIVGLFTGIIWYTKEYSEPPPAPLNVDSLLAAGVVPDSLNVYDKERYQLEQQKAMIAAEEEAQKRRQAELEQQKQQLQDLQQQLSSASAEEDSIMDIQYTELAKLYESMKPVEAGAVMNNLPDYSAAQILTRMSKRQAGRVMNSMDTDKSVKVSQLITLLKN
jgi:flagellar motility protein MotE (MotC chaperone)